MLSRQLMPNYKSQEEYYEEVMGLKKVWIRVHLYCIKLKYCWLNIKLVFFFNKINSYWSIFNQTRS
jgi:hypothetical protein